MCKYYKELYGAFASSDAASSPREPCPHVIFPPAGQSWSRLSIDAQTGFWKANFGFFLVSTIGL